MSAVHPGFSNGISEIHITVQYRAIIYITSGPCGPLALYFFDSSTQFFWCLFFFRRATTHPLCPENSDHVRVQSYNSRMVILPHRAFDEVRVFSNHISLSFHIEEENFYRLQ